MADHGTIFLDEIGDLTLQTQVKLLRIFQEREFERLGGTQTIKIDVRIICATHRNLEEMVKNGQFREDLFYRINVFPILIPPLRDRKDDLPLLIDHFIHKFNRINHKKIKGINRAALDMLLMHEFPGNIRELENIIERAVVICTDEIIGPKHLPNNLVSVENLELPNQGASLPEIVEAIEKQRISEALKTQKSQRQAAKALGLTERMLGYKIKKYQISA
jgi:Nif-specific regulatory protein